MDFGCLLHFSVSVFSFSMVKMASFPAQGIDGLFDSALISSTVVRISLLLSKSGFLVSLTRRASD